MNIINTIATPDKATNKAVKSGLWSAPDTWDTPPTDGAKVYVPSGLTVTISGDEGETPFWTLVEGVLRYDPDTSSNFSTESLFVMHHGRLEIVSDEIQQLTFPALSGKKIDWAYDPMEVSRGLVVEGTVQIEGKKKTPFLSVKNLPPVGALGIQVETAPSGWEVGDELCLTSGNYDQEEFFLFQGYTSGVVQLDHAIVNLREFPIDPTTGMVYAECRLHVANLTRNIKLGSSLDAAGNRELQGHVMLMHGPHMIAGVEFDNLGRTTIDEVTDPRVENDKRIVDLAPLCGLNAENTRGRYALHFHMAGPDSAKSTVDSVVVRQAKNSRMKFGVIIHSSHVDCLNAVVLNVDGSHYMTEEGDERGQWKNCIAIHSKGHTEGGKDHHPDDGCMLPKYPEIFHRHRLDVGFQGAGFWPQGGGVDVIDCVAAGQFSTGIDTWTRPLDFRRENTFHVAFPTKCLPDPSWVQPPQEMIEIDHVPIVIRGFHAYGVDFSDRYSQMSGVSFKYTGHKQKEDFPLSPYSICENVVVWNARHGVVTAYAGNVYYKNVLLVQGNAKQARQTGKGMQLGTQGGNHNKLENVRVDGFEKPIGMSTDTTVVNVTVDGTTFVPPPDSGDGPR